MITDQLKAISDKVETDVNLVFNINDGPTITNEFLGTYPIYKKLIHVDPLVNNGRINTYHLIENLRTLLNFTCIVKNTSNGNYYDAPAIKKELSIEFSCTVTDVLVSLAMNGDLTGYTALIILEYTID